MALVGAVAVICEKILLERDGVTTLVRVVDVFTVPENASVDLSLWTQIRITADDDAKHSLDLELVRPDGERQRSAVFKDTVLAAASNYPNSPHRIATAQGKMLVARATPGLYAFEVLFDGNVIAKTYFVVNATQEPTQPASPNFDSSPLGDTVH
jgi:hypothetical protein